MSLLCKIRKHSNALAQQPGTSVCIENQTVQFYTALDIGYSSQDHRIYSIAENTTIVGSINAESKGITLLFPMLSYISEVFLDYISILIAIVCCLASLIKPKYLMNNFPLIKLIFVLILITLVCLVYLHQPT